MIENEYPKGLHAGGYIYIYIYMNTQRGSMWEVTPVAISTQISTLSLWGFQDTVTHLLLSGVQCVDFDETLRRGHTVLRAACGRPDVPVLSARHSDVCHTKVSTQTKIWHGNYS